jgi:glycosyltransferase involved in cell wall biosynthesis
MGKVRILFLPPVDAGNTNAQSLNVREIVLRLDPERIESTLWYEHAPDPRLLDRLGIHLLRLPQSRKTLRILREMLSGYDLIAYMDYSPASYLFLHIPCIFRARTKAVFHAEAPRAQLVNPSRLLRFLHRGVLSRSDAYTGITEFVAEDMREVAKPGVRHILPIGVDSRFYGPPSLRKHPTPTVLFVGTVIERKGPQLLLEAARRIPQARFRIVGATRDGFSATIQQKVNELKLQNLALEGPRSQTEVRDIMWQSDIFILPSRLEGMPKVTLEAAATGLPSLVFRDYQTPSVIDGITGFQVNTEEEMLTRLEQLIEDPELRNRMGRNAREHAMKFDWDAVSPLWENAYLQIAAQR